MGKGCSRIITPQTTPKGKEQELLEIAKASRCNNFIHEIMLGNQKWCNELFSSLDVYSDPSFLDKQTPISTVLSCCDSRAPTAAMGAGAPNEIFSVRNIGNQFCNSIGSFRYGLEVLKTRYAIIMGHTN